MTHTSASLPPSLFPTFRFQDAARMIDWLCQALGFTVHARYDNEDGTVGHAELAHGSSLIMVGQDRDDAYGRIVGTSGQQGGKSVYAAVSDVEAVFENARSAGATIVEGLTERDYGSREFTCRDPEGNVWTFGTYWPKVEGRP